ARHARQGLEVRARIAPARRALELAAGLEPPVAPFAVGEARVLDVADDGVAAGIGRRVASDEDVALHARAGEERADRRLAAARPGALDAVRALQHDVVAEGQAGARIAVDRDHAAVGEAGVVLDGEALDAPEDREEPPVAAPLL